MADDAHSQRAHARLSPSAAHRWMECPGSVRLSADIPRSSSAYADEGTAAHELAAHCLDHGWNAERFLGHIINIDGVKPPDKFIPKSAAHPDGARVFEVTEEMAEGVQLYCDYVREHASAKEALTDIEYRIDLQHIASGMFGTGDCVIYKPSERRLLVIDFKYGRGVPVEPDENPQLMLYGLGAIKRHHNLPLLGVTLVIVQPRARHPKGPVREWHTDPTTMFEFEDRARECALATESDTARLFAGEWCRFCPVAATCTVHREKIEDISGISFDALNEAELIDPKGKNPEDLARLLTMAGMVHNWANAVMAYAHDQAALGFVPPGWKLVDKRAIRKWKDPVAAAEWLEMVMEIDREKIFETSLRSPAQIEKVLPGRNAEIRSAKLAGFVVKQSSGLVLVPEHDVRAGAVSDGAHFDAIVED